MSLILAAGNGQRFVDAGYTTIKPLLSMPDGRPVLAWVRDTLPDAPQVLVARRQDARALAPWTGGMEVVWIDKIPNGPLACALAAAYTLPIRGEVLVSHCDSWLAEGTDAFLAAARSYKAQIAVVVFPSNDPRYGYWDGKKIVEKQVVSPWAVSGLYYFRRGATLARRLCTSMPHHAYDSMANLIYGDNVYCHPVNQPIDLGTPDEYEAFLSGAAV